MPASIYYWWLDDDWEPHRVADVLTWASKFEAGSRVLKRTTIGRGVISTAFLGIDMGFGRSKSRPILWETMVFDVPEMDRYTERHATKAEALKAHDRIAAGALGEWGKKYKRLPKVKIEELIVYPPRTNPTIRPLKKQLKKKKARKNA